MKNNHHTTITKANHTISVLDELLEGLPIGTNLAMMHVFWALLSGQLLPSRGALFPALKAIGLEDDEVRRGWTAINSGVWQTTTLIARWSKHVEGLSEWKRHEYEGYKPVVADITAFWRPTLKNCPSQHYHPAAGRALPAVIFGVVGKVGEINGQRIALPQAFERVHPKDPSEKRLWRIILKNVKKTLSADEIVVVDAGVKVSDLQEAEIEQYELRLANNFTARRNVLPDYCGVGRMPVYGELIRPLARTHNGKVIAATAPDEIQSWEEKGHILRAEIWRNLVLPDCAPDAHNQTFDVYAIYDPDFDTPWLLATPVVLKPISVRNMYKDRWPVEQIPLSAKQMIGSHRQFVHAEETIQRLPELALMAGSILSFLAATAPATPTGFWDRKPKRTPGRFRRTLAGRAFPEVANLSGRLRKKNSVTAHLPKGHLARLAKNAPKTETPALC
ncbi:MAG: hypothetical protein A3K41_13810 [Chloroflexi bacterium RIFOXYD12_FULL_57_15]|nr:MAG: hypothetical protein A3K41_13810 [Chloroflexi bacterium RIFOXYD12_FULL_57_15]